MVWFVEQTFAMMETESKRARQLMRVVFIRMNCIVSTNQSNKLNQPEDKLEGDLMDHPKVEKPNDGIETVELIQTTCSRRFILILIRFLFLNIPGSGEPVYMFPTRL